jgi:peptidylprolyl isomerase
MKTVGILIVIAAICGGLYWVFMRDNTPTPPPLPPPVPESPSVIVSMDKTNATNTEVILKTNQGDITLEMFTDTMPITTENFLKLARQGFYNGTKFHRVISGFMIQGGDPNSKGGNAASYGTGGPGYTIKDEFVAGLSNLRGTIAMANTGAPNSGGSQFFINLVDNTGLDFDKPPVQSSHPVFGKVIEGMDIVDTIGKTATGANDLPINAIVIESIEVKGM